MASPLAVAFARSNQNTSPDATTTTTAATHNVELNASRYDDLAAVAIAPPRAPPADAADCSASASECVAFSGRPLTAPFIEERKCDATRLPITATPSAPPSSRVVSFTAEPTPALCSGSDRMIAPVDGAVVMPMPSAWTTTLTANHP